MTQSTRAPRFSKQAVDGAEIYTVDGPDILRDKLIPLNGEGADLIAKRMGVKPVRASLSRWRTDGYPIDRNGPRVRLPYVTRLKRVYTSVPALTRWFQMVQALGDEIREAGGVSRWRQQNDNGSSSTNN